ncbi:hypothetical protein [Streptomyces pristinaespiralis]
MDDVGYPELDALAARFRPPRTMHSVRCSAYGVLGGVLDKTMAGF